MPALRASAPGKIILFGEHAVVYGRPAIAVPVTQVHANVMLLANPGGESTIEAPDIGMSGPLSSYAPNHPLALGVSCVQAQLGLTSLPAFRMKITSSIPLAAGLGSGAAVSVALARALSAFLGHLLSDQQVNEVAYRVEQVYHGTPSGIDNTVITYAQPVWYVRGSPFEFLTPTVPFTVVIANTGIASATGAVVSDLRRRWVENPAAYEPIFNRIGAIAREARSLMEHGRPEEMGPLMTTNHDLLRKLDVSSPELDGLVSAALAAGALGAKLCGGGRGGNMIALARVDQAACISTALTAAGATQTIITEVKA